MMTQFSVLQKPAYRYSWAEIESAESLQQKLPQSLELRFGFS